MNFPSDEAIQYGYVAGGYRAPIRATLEAAYAIDEPKIREDERRKLYADWKRRGADEHPLVIEARADQTRKIVEALRKNGYNSSTAPEFIEREFGSDASLP